MFCHETRFYILCITFCEPQSLFPQTKAKVSFWCNPPSWNNVLCFMFYHLSDPIFYTSRLKLNYFWGHALSCHIMKQCFIFYVLPFTKLNPSCPWNKVRVSFWYKFLCWNNFLCFMFYHLPDLIFNTFKLC